MLLGVCVEVKFARTCKEKRLVCKELSVECVDS